MIRIKRGNIAQKYRKKILHLAKSFRGAHSKLFRIANVHVLKALKYSYFGRKQKKQQFRAIWILRLNAAIQSLTKTHYAIFIKYLKLKNILLNRKILAYLLIFDHSILPFIIKILKF